MRCTKLYHVTFLSSEGLEGEAYVASDGGESAANLVTLLMLDSGMDARKVRATLVDGNIADGAGIRWISIDGNEKFFKDGQ